MNVSLICKASVFPSLSMSVVKLLFLTVKVYEREKEESS